MSKYLTPAATAKLIRMALKAHFPGFKFGVRSQSYAGGGSARVTWTDGPSENQVKPVVEQFEGATFDGMTDYKGGHVYRFRGEEVHFGADFLFCDRDYSDEAREEAKTSLNLADSVPEQSVEHFTRQWLQRRSWYFPPAKPSQYERPELVRSY